MNIFGIGGAELVVIILIMLVVAGPQRMLRWAYILGRWTARLRDMWKEAMAVIQKEIDEAGVDIRLPEEIPTRQNLVQWGQQAIKPYTDKMREAEAELRGELADVEKEVKDLESDVNAVSYDVKRINRALKSGERPPKATKSTPAKSGGDVDASKKGSTTGGDANFGTWGAAPSVEAQQAASQAAKSSAPASPGDEEPPAQETDFGSWSGS